MKYVLMFVVLSGNPIYGMEGLSEKSKNLHPYRNYYQEAVQGILGKYHDEPKSNAMENAGKIKQLPDNATPLQIVGFLKTLHDNEWHRVDGFIVRSKL